MSSAIRVCEQCKRLMHESACHHCDYDGFLKACSMPKAWHKHGMGHVYKLGSWHLTVVGFRGSRAMATDTNAQGEWYYCAIDGDPKKGIIAIEDGIMQKHGILSLDEKPEEKLPRLTSLQRVKILADALLHAFSAIEGRNQTITPPLLFAEMCKFLHRNNIRISLSDARRFLVSPIVYELGFGLVKITPDNCPACGFPVKNTRCQNQNCMFHP